MPTRRKLTSDEPVEANGLGDEDPSTALELNEPLAGLLDPDVAVDALLALELLGVGGRDLDGLEVVSELDLLVEGLLLGVVAVEELGLYREWKGEGW